ncbi:hypothetical protein DRI50_07665 [candidate division KSB1 bacterium]|nr:MAG: hypothetical protein DRI50_07665 [candidate division KSB1 bacterium]
MLTSRTTSRVVLLCWSILFLVPVMLFSKGQFQKQWVQPISMNDQTDGSLLNVGNWGYWVKNNGLSAHDPYTDGGGGYYPKGKVPIIYTEGLLWGAILKDKATGIALTDTPRVGGIYYHAGTQPGWINADGTPADVNDARVRIYRIRSDWRNLSEADLRAECAYLYHVEPVAVTETMLQAVREQYKEDWRDWPVDLGAPYVDVNGNGMYDPVLDSLGCPDATQGDYPGIRDADQVIWLVANDLNETATFNLSGSLPIGLEARITYWTYKGPYNPLINVIFKRVELINKSGFVLDSMYVSFFSDPDIGDYNNDLVGCDSVRSTAFAYNGTDTDKEFQEYGLKPAAIEYDLLQGPMIKTGNAQDTAIFDFKYQIGYKNLKMTSFSPEEIVTLGNPPMGDLKTTFSAYNMMRGFRPLIDFKHPIMRVFYSGPRAGQPTKFPLSGNPLTDPYAQLGDIDGQGGNLPPGERRMFLNSGPFTMQPGERQEVVVAIIGGLGKDRLNSLQQVWETDMVVKRLYKHLLADLPKPPATPVVRATPLDNQIVLNWGVDSLRIKEIEETSHGGYEFEGYTVYQLPSPDAQLTDDGVKRLATFDRVDGVKDIFAYFYSPKYRRTIYAPVQYGTDSGIKRHFTVSWDSVNNRPLYSGSTYYFAVTAYNYNKDYERYPSMESAPQIVAVTVQGPKPGERYEAKPDEELEVRQEGTADVKCQVVVADPSETTGHQYEVFFTQVTDPRSPDYGQYVWNLKDVTENKVVLNNQKIFTPRDSSEIARFPAIYVDGLDIKVYNTHKQGIKAIVEVANGNGPLPKDQWDDEGAPYHGNNVWHSLSASTDPNRFYISAGGGDGELARIERSIANAKGHDFELRFTPAGGIFAWWYDNVDTAATVPFAIWDVGIGTYDDHSDDVRCLTGGYSGGETVGVFDFACTDAALGFPATDWIYARVPLDSKGSYQAFYNDVTSGAWTYEWWRHSREVLSRIVICDFGGARTLPEAGTVIRFITYKAPSDSLKYYFTAPGRVENDLTLAKKDVEKINVFPNPYYAGAEWSPNGPVRGVTFTHLPQHAIIRIFALNGLQVRKFEKRDDSQFLRWDLHNAQGKPVASGLYIVHIDMPELKKTKKLKLMVIMGE